MKLTQFGVNVIILDINWHFRKQNTKHFRHFAVKHGLMRFQKPSI